MLGLTGQELLVYRRVLDLVVKLTMVSGIQTRKYLATAKAGLEMDKTCRTVMVYPQAPTTLQTGKAEVAGAWKALAAIAMVGHLVPMVGMQRTTEATPLPERPKYHHQRKSRQPMAIPSYLIWTTKAAPTASTGQTPTLLQALGPS